MFLSRRHKQLSNFLLPDIDDYHDKILYGMCNFIVIHVQLDGTLLAIDNFIIRALVIWIQFKTFLFRDILI